MPEYMFLMHDDANNDATDEASDNANDWQPYLSRLQGDGHFERGSAIGHGICVRKDGDAPAVTAHLTGYIRVNADDLAHAKSMLAGNPHFEAGNRRDPRTAADGLMLAALCEFRRRFFRPALRNLGFDH